MESKKCINNEYKIIQKLEGSGYCEKCYIIYLTTVRNAVLMKNKQIFVMNAKKIIIKSPAQGYYDTGDGPCKKC